MLTGTGAVGNTWLQLERKLKIFTGNSGGGSNYLVAVSHWSSINKRDRPCPIFLTERGSVVQLFKKNDVHISIVKNSLQFAAPETLFHTNCFER